MTSTVASALVLTSAVASARKKKPKRIKPTRDDFHFFRRAVLAKYLASSQKLGDATENGAALTGLAVDYYSKGKDYSDAINKSK